MAELSSLKTVGTGAAFKSVIGEITEWARTQPSWLQDALRRIIESGNCSDGDCKELCGHIVDEVTKADFTASVYKPLAEQSSEKTLSGPLSASLISVRHKSGVNRLAEDQHIEFAPTGMTIIYGDNGSGKSGYARIIKSVCRFRGHASSIECDVREANPKTASAEISLHSNGENETITWKSDLPTNDARLRSMFIFDSFVAASYMNEEDSAKFFPFGLQIPKQLISVMDTIKADLGTRIEVLRVSNIERRKNIPVENDTACGQLLAAPQLNQRDLDHLCNISDEERLKVAHLKSLLDSEDPAKHAAKLTENSIRIIAFRKDCAAAIKLLGTESLSTLEESLVDYHIKLEAAEQVRAALAGSALLPGVAGKEWRLFWDAATVYSSRVAYPEKNFPNRAEGARCVLCQEPLTEEAKQRLEFFAQSLTKTQEQAVRAAESRITTINQAYIEHLPLSDKFRTIDTMLTELISESQIEQIRGSCTSTDERIRVLANILKSKSISPLVDMSSIDFLSYLDSAINLLADHITQAQTIADPEGRKSIQREYSELNDRLRLGEYKVQVNEYFKQARLIKQLDDRRQEIKSRELSDQAKVWSNHYVTESFCLAFEEELKRLAMRALSPQLSTRTPKGETVFGIKLAESARRVAIVNIASEGEQRTIALACYLAELGQCSEKSSLIFDDPVSSLDHTNRRRIAVRLADESRKRQIIVFTHDPVFMQELCDSCEQSGLPVFTGHLEWGLSSDGQSRPGFFQAGLPWIHEKVPARLDKLQKELGEIKRNPSPHPGADEEKRVREWYSCLRATLERIVEQCLLAGVVFRFRDYVNIKDLLKVTNIDTREVAELQRLFNQCCDQTDSHDHASARNASIPTPDEMHNDWEATHALVKAITARQAIRKVC